MDQQVIGKFHSIIMINVKRSVGAQLEKGGETQSETGFLKGYYWVSLLLTSVSI